MKVPATVLCVFIASLLGLATPGFAQNPAPKFGVTLGYGALRSDPNPCTECDWNWYQAGFNVDAAVPIAEPLQIVGEFGWYRHPFREDPLRQAGGLNAISAGAGLRWSRNGPSFAPFAQIIAGLHRDTVHGGTGVGLTGFAGEGFPRNSFMVQPGAGVVIPFKGAYGIVGQVDYRRAFTDEGTNAIRVVVGVRLSRN